MRNGDIQKCCQVPLLGLRVQNEIDGRDHGTSKAPESGATTLEDYSLGPLDRRKGLSWRKQELMTCQTELNCFLLHPSQSGAPELSHARVLCDVSPFNKEQAEILPHFSTTLFNF